MKAQLLKRYIVYACDNWYGGLHGMNSYSVVRGTIKDAEDFGKEESLDIINSYSSIYETLTDNAEEQAQLMVEDGDDRDYDDIFGEIYDELAHEDICYEIFEIDEEKAKDVSDELIDRLLSIDPQQVIEDYCKEPIEYQ